MPGANTSSIAYVGFYSPPYREIGQRMPRRYRAQLLAQQSYTQVDIAIHRVLAFARVEQCISAIVQKGQGDLQLRAKENRPRVNSERCLKPGLL